MTNAAVAYVSRRFRRKNADTAFRTGWPPQTPFVDEPHRRMDRERHRQPPMSPVMRSLDRACGDRVMPRLPFRNPVAVRSKHSSIDADLHHICCSHITAMDAPRLRRQSETRPRGAGTQEISRNSTGGARHLGGRKQHHRRQSRRLRERTGVFGKRSHRRDRCRARQSPQARSRQMPERGARGLKREAPARPTVFHSGIQLHKLNVNCE
jgi:hypothetical protein